MSDLRTAAQQALEALESTQLYCAHEHYPRRRVADAITALRAALEQPEQEPVAWLESPYGSIRMNTTMRFQFPPQSLKWKIPLYTHPPRREWRGLTEDEMVALAGGELTRDERMIARAIEAALKERNA